jgi:hypothetical protein
LRNHSAPGRQAPNPYKPLLPPPNSDFFFSFFLSPPQSLASEPASEVSIRSQHPKSASEARARCQVSRPQNPIPDPQGQGEGRDDCVNIEFPSIRTQIPHNPIFQTRLEGDLDRIRMTHNLSPESFDILLHAFAILLIFVCLCFIDLALFFSAALLLHFALSCVHLDGRTPR